MDQILQWFQNAPLVIAHRGASAYAPENTLSAFRQAIEMNSDAVELDAKLLKDNTVIVLHDTTLERTTNGKGSVYQFGYDEIKNLDSGSHFSSKFSNERIPRLSEIFDEMGDKILINVELTNYAQPWDKLPRSVISLVHRNNLKKRILLSSFNPWALLVAKRVDPEIPRALLVHSGEPGVIRMVLKRIIDHEAFHPHFSLVSEKQMSEAKRDHKKVNVWTVNETSQMMELLDLGVDGLITDFPDIARKIIDGPDNG